MPIFSLLLGVLFIVAGIRGNARDIFSQLKDDASGFLALGAAIMVLAILGASDTFRPISKGLLFLLFVVYLLNNGNAVIKGLTDSASAMSDANVDTKKINPNEPDTDLIQQAIDTVNRYSNAHQN